MHSDGSYVDYKLNFVVLDDLLSDAHSLLLVACVNMQHMRKRVSDQATKISVFTVVTREIIISNK